MIRPLKWSMMQNSKRHWMNPKMNYQAVLQINSGAGGTEKPGLGRNAGTYVPACMVKSRVESNRDGLAVATVQVSATCTVLQFDGPFAYGFLKQKAGYTAWCISPFDSNARRHTFSSLYVYPLVDDTITGEIKTGWCKNGNFPQRRRRRQNVKKWKLKAQLTHIPTGIVSGVPAGQGHSWVTGSWPCKCCEPVWHANWNCQKEMSWKMLPMPRRKRWE